MLVPVLQKGVYVPLSRPESISSFISKLLTIDNERMRKDIKTIMLNNRVVDDPDRAVLHAGDALVLSGAMPGLVGAMLRSDSPLKVMRATISEANTSGPGDGRESLICVKLFNTVLKTYHEAILTHGFFIPDDKPEGDTNGEFS